MADAYHIEGSMASQVLTDDGIILKLNDAIVNITDVYRVFSNRDNTQVASEFEMEVTNKYNDKYTILENMDVRVRLASVAGAIIFNGYVTNIKTNYSQRSKTFRVKHIMNKLKDFPVTWAELTGTAIGLNAESTGVSGHYNISDTDSVSGLSFYTVRMLWLIERGVRLITNYSGTRFSSNALVNPASTTPLTAWNVVIETVNQGANPRNITYHDYCMSLELLSCVNQTFAAQHETVDASQDNRDSRPSFWDLYNWFQEKFNLRIKPSRLSTIQLEIGTHVQGGLTPPSDDDTYEKDVDIIPAIAGGYQGSMSFGNGRDEYRAPQSNSGITISFSYNGASVTDKINDSANGFGSFTTGEIAVQGAGNVENNKIFTVTAVTANQLTLDLKNSLVTEAVGNNVTIIQSVQNPIVEDATTEDGETSVRLENPNNLIFFHRDFTSSAIKVWDDRTGVPDLNGKYHYLNPLVFSGATPVSGAMFNQYYSKAKEVTKTETTSINSDETEYDTKAREYGYNIGSRHSLIVEEI